MFVLFNQAVGGFTTVNLPALGAGQAWMNNVAVDGTIRVVSTGAASIGLAQFNAGQLALSWPTDHLGWRLQVQTNDVLTGLNTNWWDVTNTAATNQVILPVSSANGSVFFRLIYP